jgi:pectate lyase
MKKVLLSIILSVPFVLAQGVDYCASSSWGYAGTGVTGGGSATPTLVTNESELATALGKKGTVIIITQDITVTDHISSDKSNLTIMALPGVKLISKQQNKDHSGILYLKGDNLLLRNLTFVGPGAYDCDGWDNLCLDKATNVWVDHCDFQDGCDGNFDIKSTADNITVTWCRFRYLKAPKAGGSGGSDDHRFSNLIGSGSSDKPSDGTYNITYAYCWWDEGCKQRMTRCRNCELHFLNCYWNSSVADYYVGPEKAKCYFEGCTFAGAANSASKIWKPFNGTTNYCTFVNCAGDLPANSSTPVAAPSYGYDSLSPGEAKSYVTNSQCGAGATLTVTNAGAVSSGCDSPTGMEDVPDGKGVRKIIYNNKVYILQEGKTYTLTGSEVIYSR